MTDSRFQHGARLCASSAICHSGVPPTAQGVSTLPDHGGSRRGCGTRASGSGRRHRAGRRKDAFGGTLLSVLLSAATPALAVDVATEIEFQNAFVGTSSTSTLNIRLTEDLSLQTAYTFPAVAILNIDTNGYTINIGAGASLANSGSVNFVDNSHPTIFVGIGNITTSGRLTIGQAGGYSATSITLTNDSGARLVLNGADQSIGGLSGGGSAGGTVALGAQTLTVNQATDATFAGPITGSGSLVKTGTGRLDLTGDSGTYSGDLTVNGGTLKVNGTFGTAGCTTCDIIVNAGGTLGGSGLINGKVVINAGATYSPGNSPGTNPVNGSFTVNGGTYRVEIDGTGTGNGAGNFDRTIVSGTPGTFTINGGGLTPVLRGLTGATNSYTPPIGQTFTFVQASGGVIGSFSGLTQPSDGLPAGSRFDVVYGTTTVDAVVTPAAYGNLGAAGIGQSANHAQVGQALDAIRPAAGIRPSGDLKTLFDALYPSASGQIGPALDQISGAVHASAGLADLSSRRLAGRSVDARMAAARDGGLSAHTLSTLGALQFGSAGGTAGFGAAGGGLAAGDAVSRPYETWGQVLGGYGSTGSDGNGAGFDRWTGGTLVAGEWTTTPDFRVGAGVGYARTHVSGDHGGGSADIDSYQAFVYGSWTLERSFVDAQFGYAFNRYDTSRPIRFGSLDRTARADADGHDFDAAIKVGRSYDAGGFSLEPAVGLRYDLITRGGFSESGADSLDLSLRSEQSHFLQTAVGVRALTRVAAGSLTLEPEASLAWTYDALDRAPQSHAAIGGAGFTVDASKPGRHAAVFSLGSAAIVNDRLKGYVRYDGAARARQTDHALVAGIRYAW